MSAIFHTLFYDPLYNVLIFFVDIMPRGDLGLALIATTLLVKTILYPLYHQTAVTQAKMRLLQPQIAALKEKFKDDKRAEAEAAMKLYQENKLHPFSGILTILFQIPVFLALYWIFSNSGLPQVHLSTLYSFIPVPEQVMMEFLGVLNLGAKHSLLAALLAGISQYVLFIYTLPKIQPRVAGAAPNFAEDFQRSMNMNMKFFFPVLIAVFAYNFPTAVALYWVTNSVTSLGQEYFVRRRLARVGLSRF